MLWMGAAILALVWGDFLLCMGIYAIVRRYLARRRTLGGTSVMPPGRMLLLRPCAGHEPDLERCLVSAAHARTTLAMEVRMGVSTADDTALPAARRAVETLRSRGIPDRKSVV